MGPPLCLSCKATTCTEIESRSLRHKWSCEDGFKWQWHNDQQAYWRMCLPCHRVHWPTDSRTRNRYSTPHPKRQSGSKSKFLVGDLYLTESPPELLRSSLQTSALVACRPPFPRTRSRTPGGQRCNLHSKGCLKGSRPGPPPTRVS